MNKRKPKERKLLKRHRLRPSSFRKNNSDSNKKGSRKKLKNERQPERPKKKLKLRLLL